MFEHRNILNTILAVTTLGMLAGCVSQSTYVKEQTRANGLDSQLAAATKQNQDLSQQLSQAQQQLDQTKQTAEDLAKQKSEQDQVVSSLQNEVQAGQIQITQLAGKLSINMVDKILFNSGSAKLNDAGQKVLMQVGNAIKNVSGKRIWIGGHTDNVPISPSLRDTFASNWELSTARATAVARFLQEKVGIPGDKLIAAGYAEFQPIADNSTPEGREQNRRIEILLVPLESPAAKTPAASASSPAPAASAPPAQDQGAPTAAPAASAPEIPDQGAPTAAPTDNSAPAPAASQ